MILIGLMNKNAVYTDQLHFTINYFATNTKLFTLKQHQIQRILFMCRLPIPSFIFTILQFTLKHPGFLLWFA